MIIKKIKELYNVDTISQDKGWKKIQEALPENEEIMIDFSGTYVVDPWDCAEFKKLLKNPLVHMKFVNCDEMVRRIKIMCVVEGLDENHIINEVVEIPKEKTAEEKKVERIGTDLVSSFEIDGTSAYFKASNKYSQLHSTNTLNYIKFAIDKLIEEKGINKIILDFNGVSVLRNVIELVADMIVDLKKNDVELIIDITDEESVNNLKLFIHQATNKKYDEKERTKAILKNLKPNTAVILVKYKKSKAVDEFGRHGNGEVISSRIALFKGIKQSDNGQDVLLIDSFNDKYFYTKQHWMVEHDNEIPSGLHPDSLEIPVMEIGYGDLFLGSDYHFMAPVQQNINENRTIIKEVDENDRNIKVSCTIPERIKIVFDDWNIKYDAKALDNAIDATNKLLHIGE